jgi:nicotinamide mononucleotide (NMN) deamidase PncC
MSVSSTPALTDAAERIVRTAKAFGCTVATVESCTAGALACLLADAHPDEDGNEVGLVHVAAATRNGAELHLERRFGARSKEEIVQQSMLVALTLLGELVAA